MADKDSTIDKIDFETVTINSGETESTNVDMRGMTLCGLYLPSALTSVAITFQVSDESGGTYIPIADGLGSTLSKVVAQGQYIKLDPSDFAGVQFIKLVAGTAEGGDREIKLALRQV